MDINIKTKWCWPFSLIFKPKESQFDILEELTPDEKRLEKKLKLDALKSAIKADRADSARSLRAENDFCMCGQIKHVGYDKCRDCLEDELV